MSTQPDKAAAVEQKPQTPCADPELKEMSERQFLRDHSILSAISSWLFAISGATNIGVLGVLSSKILNAVEKGKPIFKSNDPAVPSVFGNKKFNYIAAGMMVFGGACMAVSNWLESMKIVTEWRLGKQALKFQRKADIAESFSTQAASADQIPATAPVAPGLAIDATAAASRPKDWGASLQSKIVDPITHPAKVFRHG